MANQNRGRKIPVNHTIASVVRLPGVPVGEAKRFTGGKPYEFLPRGQVTAPDPVRTLGGLVAGMFQIFLLFFGFDGHDGEVSAVARFNGTDPVDLLENG